MYSAMEIHFNTMLHEVILEGIYIARKVQKDPSNEFKCIYELQQRLDLPCLLF